LNPMETETKMEMEVGPIEGIALPL
jgi:hypothetical protein